MIDLLKPLLDWNSLARQTVDADRAIIAGGEPTSILFCLEDGTAISADGESYGVGDMLGLCEVLALDHYATRIDASAPCRLVPSTARCWSGHCTAAAGLCCPCHVPLLRISRSDARRKQAKGVRRPA